MDERTNGWPVVQLTVRDSSEPTDEVAQESKL
jgi:hypothetical protein